MRYNNQLTNLKHIKMSKKKKNKIQQSAHKPETHQDVKMFSLKLLSFMPPLTYILNRPNFPYFTSVSITWITQNKHTQTWAYTHTHMCTCIHTKTHTHTQTKSSSQVKTQALPTFDPWSLQCVVHGLAPSHRVDVWWLTVYPLVILVFPAIKVYAQEATHNACDGGHTDEARLHEVHCLNLHPRSKPVFWDFLS